MKCEWCGKEFSKRKGRFCGTCQRPDPRRDLLQRYKSALEAQVELVNSNIITTWPDIAGRLIAIAKEALEI